jgi:CRISPR-associated protein Csh2
MSFKNRVYGCAIIKAKNANYNADFTHQPRTLPDGTLYATDKVLKYSIRNYIKQFAQSEHVFFTKTFKEDLKVRDIKQRYEQLFSDDESDKKVVLKNLLDCIDVRLFGATYASKKANISIHGPVQIEHGVNKFAPAESYSEQIMSPFSTSEGKSDASTLGSQAKVTEAHYVHSFSVNPYTLQTQYELAGDGHKELSENDIQILKDALCRGVTAYSSTAKAGTENECLLWITLKEDSTKMVPSLTDLLSISDDGVIDLQKVSDLLEVISDDVDSVELYANTSFVQIDNIPEGVKVHPLS